VPQTYVVDSTNTTRLVRRLFIVDSTNTTRLVKRVFIVDSTNTARLVYVAAQVIPVGLSAVASYPATATCTITFNTSGTETVQSNQIPVPETLGNWAYPPTSGYQIKATLQSGTTPAGTLNTWLPATVARTWSLQKIGPGIVTCSLLIQISTNSSSVIASGVVTMYSEVDNQQ
jgi:hypothetical protein